MLVRRHVALVPHRRLVRVPQTVHMLLVDPSTVWVEVCRGAQLQQRSAMMAQWALDLRPLTRPLERLFLGGEPVGTASSGERVASLTIGGPAARPVLTFALTLTLTPVSPPPPLLLLILLHLVLARRRCSISCPSNGRRVGGAHGRVRDVVREVGGGGVVLHLARVRLATLAQVL